MWLLKRCLFRDFTYLAFVEKSDFFIVLRIRRSVLKRFFYNLWFIFDLTHVSKSKKRLFPCLKFTTSHQMLLSTNNRNKGNAIVYQMYSSATLFYRNRHSSNRETFSVLSSTEWNRNICLNEILKKLPIKQ